MRFLIRSKWILALSILLLVITGIPYLKKALIPNNELSIWFVENDPALKAYQDFNDRYGNDRLVMILLYDSTGIFKHERIQQINDFTQQVIKVEGVKKVYSLTNLKDLFRTRINDTTRIKYESPFNGVNTEDPDSMNKIRAQILASTLFNGRVIDKEGKSSIILIQLESFDEVDLKRGMIIDEIEFIARKTLHIENVHLGGLDVLSYELNKLSKHDFGLFIGINLVVMFLFIFFFFRKWVYVFLSMVTMMISVMLTLSFYGLAGKQLNLFCLVIPSLVVILGLINILHIINEFEFSSRPNGLKLAKKELIVQSLQKVFRPCLFTTLTTIIGFLTLLSSSTSVLRDFGLFAAFGIFIAFICSFVFSAVVLPFVNLSHSGEKIRSWIANQLVRISKNIQLNIGKYWAGVIILCVISLFGIRKINADMFVMKYLPTSNKIIRDHNFITKHWGNYFPIDFLVKTSQDYSFKNATMLKALYEFNKEVSSIPEINTSLSIITIMDKASSVIMNKDIERLLSSPIQTQQFINNLIQRPEIDISNFISEDFSTARMTLTGPMISVSELEKKIDEVLRISEKHFGDKAKLSVTSYPALYLKIMKYAIDSMAKSLGLATLLILITLTLLLKNIRLAIIAMIPNLLPIFLMFAFMGAMGINLDLATATVASIALGIAVDDTIHILSHYQEEIKYGHCSISDALIKTHFRIGRIVVISSIVLCVGNLVLLLASIKTVVYFGVLMFVTVSTALIGDIVLLPLLLVSFKIKP